MKYLELMRIKHYIKNLLIFMPLLFSGRLFEIRLLIETIIGFIAFSLMASIVYIINDIKDIEKDKNHPIKKNRPIVSGEVSIKQACILAIFLLITIVIIYLLTPINKLSSIIIFLYLIVNIVYSLGLKNVPILDVVLLVIGFILRTIYGAFLGGIEVSKWLYLTILVFSFFMGFGKRRNELKKNDSNSRVVLKNYNYEFLDKIIYMFLTLFIAFYSLWAMNTSSDYMIYTTFFVIIIALKYSLKLESDSFGDPVDMLLGDKILLMICIIYAISILSILYLI